jgi:hypothetical protein
MPSSIPAPKDEALHGTVDGLDALIWLRPDGTLWWCWLDGHGEVLETETHYVGWFSHKERTVERLAWRAISPGAKHVIVNQRAYPWARDEVWGHIPSGVAQMVQPKGNTL